MKLQAVFRDNPKFLNRDYLENFIQSSKATDNQLWIMSRLMEHGRVIDTLHFFTIDDIAHNLPKLKLTDYSQKKMDATN